jgi:hypothetical protein
MFASILQIVTTVATVLGLITTAIPSTQLGTVLPIIQKIQTLLSGLSSLTPPTTVDADIADLVTLLTELQTTGVFTNSTAVTQALGIIAKFQAVEADYKSGQAALIDSNFSFDGVAGDLIAVSKGGPAAEALGL